jgi:hypothetical protein
MAYTKFDDPNTKVDNSKEKVNGAFPKENMRRALQGISNRVLSGTAGSANKTAELADGSTCGILTAAPVNVVIDGIIYAAIAVDNMLMPAGTQGSNTVAKYLVYVGTDGTAAITGPGNVILKTDYSTIALAEAAAKLPDLPDNTCALGYLLLHAPTASPVYRKQQTLGTGGTTSYVNLQYMPFNG